MLPARFLDLDDARLAYSDAGRPLPLLLLHAWPLDRSMWWPQVAAFAAERRVIAPDLAGFGGSSPAGRASIAAHAADMLALLDALGLRRVVALGLSMGGYVALALARQAPDRLAGLVLADTRTEADDPAARDARARRAERVIAAGPAALWPELAPRLLGPGAPRELADRVAGIVAAQPAAGVAAALGAMAARPDTGATLAAFSRPVLVLVGERDPITPPEAAARMAATAPDARLVVLPGAGHLSNLEEPGAFNAALRGFLAGVDARAEVEGDVQH